MFEYYNTKQKVTFNTCQEAEKALGKFCACKWYEDNNWYRVEVLEWDHKVRNRYLASELSISNIFAVLQPPFGARALRTSIGWLAMD